MGEALRGKIPFLMEGEGGGGGVGGVEGGVEGRGGGGGGGKWGWSESGRRRIERNGRGGQRVDGRELWVEGREG